MMKRTFARSVLVALLVGTLALVLRRRQVTNRDEPRAPAPELVTSSRRAVPLRFVENAYKGRLGNGWADWGWGPHQLPTSSGPAKVNFAGFGGLLLHHAELRSRYGSLSFRFKAPTAWANFLSVSVKRTGADAQAFPVVPLEGRHLTAVDEGWQEAIVKWEELNPRNLPIDSISIAARSSVGSDWVLLDAVGLTEEDPNAPASAAPVREVSLTVRCNAPSHPISPLIYGASGGDWSSGVTTQRVGGNAMTRLNWDLSDTWNTGNDWFFENVAGKDGGLSAWLDVGSSHHTQTALTVPMIGWVAKDTTSVGFPRSKFGAQRKYDEQRREAGDGFSADGSPITPGPPTQTSVAAPPEKIGRWVQTLTERDRSRGERSVLMYLLDNEPSLWNVTHRDVHPEPLTYDELLDRTVRYATAIRDADPAATIAGPCEWGWTGYLYSGLDRERGTWVHADRRAHGNTALIPWYLQKLAQLETTSHKRLLDVLDVHFYPAADKVYGSNARTDAEGSELRLRSTRALWDRDYRDESWINEPIALIPLLKDWVLKYYPGRKVSLGEWSFGADDHISGALATAEALGRFGQQSLDSAFYWGGPKAGTKTLQAFRAYRNFDGQGGRFQDFSLATQEEDKVSLFASRNATGDHIVAIAINRDSYFAVKAKVSLSGCGVSISQRSFSYGANSAELSEDKSAVGGDASVLVSLPPYSLTVLDILLQPPAQADH